MDKQASRGRRQRPLRRPETGIGRPLPAPAGHDCQAGRSAVPPRGIQPVPVESVLEKARVGTDAFVRPSRGSSAPSLPFCTQKDRLGHTPFGDYSVWLLLAIIVVSDGTHTL